MRYTVPQFIDVEDKILGPLTTRQFLIMLLVVMVDAILYKTLDFVTFLLLGVTLLALGGIFAFFRVNGQPFHFFLLNMVQTLKRPAVRIWDKMQTDSELLALIRTVPPPPPKPKIRKDAYTGSKLAELSLVVNTGGVFNPED